MANAAFAEWEQGAASALRRVHGLDREEPGGSPLVALDRVRTLYAAARPRDEDARSEYLETVFGPWWATAEGRDWVPGPDYLPVSYDGGGAAARETEWLPCPDSPAQLPGVLDAAPLPKPEPREAKKELKFAYIPTFPIGHVTTYPSFMKRHEQLMGKVRKQRIDGLSAADVALRIVHPIPLSDDIELLHDTFACDGIEIERQNVPLTCPYTSARITIPARGAQCRHLATFDLLNWAGQLLKQEKPPSFWSCPIMHCDERILLGGVYVSPYMGAVLRDLPNVEAIQVHPDGSFAGAEKESDKRLDSGRSGLQDLTGDEDVRDEIVID